MSIDVFSSLSNFLSSGINTAGGIYNNERNIKIARETREDNQLFEAEQAQINRDFQSKEAELAFEREVDFYEQYKSPQAQVQQYKDAGLNPALLAGGIGATTSPSAAAPSGSQAHASGSAPVNNNPFSFVSDAFNFAGLAQAIEQRKADVKRTRAETDRIRAETDNITKNTSWIDYYNTASIDSMRAGIDKVRSDIDVNESLVFKNIQDVKESMSRISVNDSTIQVNGALVDLHGSQQVLNECRSAVERLNAQIIKAMLPYVQARQEAEIALTNAKTDEARYSAEDKMYDANLKFLRSLVDAKLIDSSYYDSVIEQSHWSVKAKKREYKWQPINDICHNMSMLMIGAGSIMSGVGGAASGLGHAAVVSQSLSPRNPIGY